MNELCNGKSTRMWRDICGACYRACSPKTLQQIKVVEFERLCVCVSSSICVWDIRNPNPKPKLTEEKNLSGIPTTFKHLDLTWKPHLKVSGKRHLWEMHAVILHISVYISKTLPVLCLHSNSNFSVSSIMCIVFGKLCSLFRRYSCQRLLNDISPVGVLPHVQQIRMK